MTSHAMNSVAERCEVGKSTSWSALAQGVGWRGGREATRRGRSSSFKPRPRKASTQRGMP